MKYKVNTTTGFDKQLARLSKKHTSIVDDLRKLGESLSEYPFQGEGLGKDMYKVRMAITSKGKGKSGGARVITLVLVTASEVRMLAIYDKSELDSISDADLKKILRNI